MPGAWGHTPTATCLSLPEALGTALQGLEHSAFSGQVQWAPATVVCVAYIGPLQCQETGHCSTHSQFCVAREA